ncbi:MAG: hypothetical protein LUQ65_02850 [Candidatus Helarchaeota archaeon]|nr:hypothetical protein [Candidatus Helarchaeota archaeon]
MSIRRARRLGLSEAVITLQPAWDSCTARSSHDPRAPEVRAKKLPIKSKDFLLYTGSILFLCWYCGTKYNFYHLHYFQV